MSVTVEVGSDATFDCVGQDNGDLISVTYIWIVFNSSNTIIQRKFVDFLDLSSFTITDVQFTSSISGVRCAVGNTQSQGSLQFSMDAYLTLVGL